MHYRRLGRSGLKVSRLILGSTLFGELMEEADIKPVLHRAWDLGVNTIDTGNIYAGGRAETLIGKLTASERHRLTLCTKVGFRIGDEPADHATALAGGHDLYQRWRLGIAPNDLGLSRKHIVSAVESSLRRLQTYYIDLYQVHRWDMETPVEETLRAMEDLIRSGKVRYIGCSNVRSWQLYEALWTSEKHDINRFESVQAPYSLLARAAEDDLFPACKHAGVGVIAFSVLAGGVLSGMHNEQVQPGTALAVRPGYQQRFMTREALKKVDQFVTFANACNRSPVQLALDGALANPAVAAAAVGVQKPEELEPLVAAITDPLPASRRQEMMAIFDKGA